MNEWNTLVRLYIEVVRLKLTTPPPYPTHCLSYELVLAAGGVSAIWNTYYRDMLVVLWQE